MGPEMVQSKDVFDSRLDQKDCKTIGACGAANDNDQFDNAHKGAAARDSWTTLPVGHEDWIVLFFFSERTRMIKIQSKKKHIATVLLKGNKIVFKKQSTRQIGKSEQGRKKKKKKKIKKVYQKRDGHGATANAKEKKTGKDKTKRPIMYNFFFLFFVVVGGCVVVSCVFLAFSWLLLQLGLCWCRLFLPETRLWTLSTEVLLRGLCGTCCLLFIASDRGCESWNRLSPTFLRRHTICRCVCVFFFCLLRFPFFFSCV